MSNYFLQMIRHLRTSEEVVLWEHMLTVSAPDEAEVAAFLADEYRTESLDYPHTAPVFDADAAVWAARTVYVAAQLVLYRQHQPDGLPALLPDYRLGVSAVAMHAVDLTLRFLPDMIQFLAQIDPDDPLISLLEHHLQVWPFSGIAYPVVFNNLDLTCLSLDECLRQRYIDRLIAYRRKPAPGLTPLWPGIEITLGNHAARLWPD